MSKFMEKNADFVHKIEAEMIRLTSEPQLSSDQVVAEAIRYSLLSGGKRVRPTLTMAIAESLGTVLAPELVSLASAIEMIHTYSLIHDDLPSMDNDDLRRGKPTNHVIYGEGMAILAGDGLLNMAYEVMFNLCTKRPDLINVCRLIAKKAGVHGMIGGQSMDLTEIKLSDQDATLDYLIKLQKLKTGGLIKAAILSGYYYAKSMLNSDMFTSELEQLFIDYADKLGLAFQIRDDILDVISTEDVLGKSIGKDARDDKLTFVSLLGIDETKLYEAKLHDEIFEILDKLKSLSVKIDFVSHFTLVLMHRDY